MTPAAGFGFDRTKASGRKSHCKVCPPVVRKTDRRLPEPRTSSDVPLRSPTIHRTGAASSPVWNPN